MKAFDSFGVQESGEKQRQRLHASIRGATRDPFKLGGGGWGGWGVLSAEEAADRPGGQRQEVRRRGCDLSPVRKRELLQRSSKGASASSGQRGHARSRRGHTLGVEARP